MNIFGNPLCVCAQNLPFEIQGNGSLLARRYIWKIFEVLGFQKTVPVYFGNVGSAATYKASSGSFVIYDQNFFNRVHTDYPMVTFSILAHEVGHIIGQHQENQNSHIRELDADRISGLVMKRVGATAEQAILKEKLFPRKSNLTHPNSVLRVKAILEGYGFPKSKPQEST
jgi:hypothetical protein